MDMIIGQWFTILDVDSALQKAGLHACLNDAALFRIDGRIAEVFDLEHGRSPTPGAGGGVRLKRRPLFPPPLPPAPPVPRRLFGPPAPADPPAPDDEPPPPPAPADPPPEPELQRWKNIAKRRRKRSKNKRTKKKLEKARLPMKSHPPLPPQETAPRRPKNRMRLTARLAEAGHILKEMDKLGVFCTKCCQRAVRRRDVREWLEAGECRGLLPDGRSPAVRIIWGRTTLDASHDLMFIPHKFRWVCTVCACTASKRIGNLKLPCSRHADRNDLRRVRQWVREAARERASARVESQEVARDASL